MIHLHVPRPSLIFNVNIDVSNWLTGWLVDWAVLPSSKTQLEAMRKWGLTRWREMDGARDVTDLGRAHRQQFLIWMTTTTKLMMEVMIYEWIYPWACIKLKLIRIVDFLKFPPSFIILVSWCIGMYRLFLCLQYPCNEEEEQERRRRRRRRIGSSDGSRRRPRWEWYLASFIYVCFCPQCLMMVMI